MVQCVIGSLVQEIPQQQRVGMVWFDVNHRRTGPHRHLRHALFIHRDAGFLASYLVVLDGCLTVQLISNEAQLE
jgi:hypothetical protein